VDVVEAWVTISLEDEGLFVVLNKTKMELEKEKNDPTKIQDWAFLLPSTSLGTDKNNDLLRLLDGTAAAGGTAGLLLVVRYNPGLFLFFLLQRVLFALTFPAAQALGGKSFVAEGRPRPKVLAALAPFDF
jgi:hypothetical protein